MSVAESPISKTDWSAVRREFPATETYAYLDIARKAILPRCVAAAFDEWVADIDGNAGAMAFSMDAVERTRSKLGRVYGAPADQIALIKNTSEGINIIAQGYPWRDGDNVVVSGLEHEANHYPWRNIRHRDVTVRVAAPDDRGRVTVDRIAEVVDARTRVVAVSWVAYGNGYRCDVDALAAFCQARDIRLVVDGIQAVGILDRRLETLGADAVVCGGHKAQLGLAGAGFAYLSPRLIECLEPPFIAKHSVHPSDTDVEDLRAAKGARRFEYGNPNHAGVWVQRRSATFVDGIGLAAIEARVRELSDYLIEQVLRRQMSVITPRAWSERAGIVTFTLDRPSPGIEKAARAENVILSEKYGGVRASVHIYNSRDDIDRLLDAVMRFSQS